MTEPTPKDLLAQSVTSHRVGDIEAAADARWAALDSMQATDPEYPGTLAAVAFSERLLGRRAMRDLAFLGEQAYGQAVINLDNKDTYTPDQLQLIERELPSVALHSAVLSARYAIHRERLYGIDEALEIYDTAHERVEEAWEGAKKLPRFDRNRSLPYLTHQHQINFARRRAVIEVVHPEGSASKALGYASLALALSPFSESRRLTANTDPNGPRFDIKAKAKALAGGAVATRAAFLGMMPGDQRRKLLAWASDRLVL